ncbi:uncharacterized protein I303_102597 [Kwoniella dejecticola CBS 10117]|uniref:F-box domain-containing protein n=1 Tax=Kwoniella dejecticola CBS 10117 TaxID=1296121 RepID=A0A1A6A971_9TREE|nr:uncharacterized protein I303_02611 [Kwoniella dejecticola CBS 10117]OBR86602.1 hypothetical protein I303_02611 [Kwoniella dejecticola CBS 10117]
MTSSTEHPILPPGILSQIFSELLKMNALRTLARFRTASKYTYRLVTPHLVKNYSVSLSQLDHLYHYYQALKGDEGGNPTRLFDPTPEGYDQRRFDELQPVRGLTLTRYPIGPSNEPTDSPTNDDAQKQEAGGSLLPKLQEIVFTPYVLRDLSQVQNRKSACAYSALIHRLSLCNPSRIIIQYPAPILEEQDLDLDSSLSTSIKNLLERFAGVEEVIYQNVHLQPLTLPSLTSISMLKKVVVRFSTHSKCPDMGGTIYHLRKKQIFECLVDLANRLLHDLIHQSPQPPREWACNDGGSTLNTHYQFRNSTSSIPQWTDNVDYPVKAKILQEKVRSELSKTKDFQTSEGESLLSNFCSTFSLVEEGVA